MHLQWANTSQCLNNHRKKNKGIRSALGCKLGKITNLNCYSSNNVGQENVSLDTVGQINIVCY